MVDNFWEGVEFDAAPDDEGIAYVLDNCPSATEIKIPSFDIGKEAAPIEVYQALYTLARVVCNDIMDGFTNPLEPNPLVEEKCILAKSAIDILTSPMFSIGVACALSTPMREANIKHREELLKELKSHLPPERI